MGLPTPGTPFPLGEKTLQEELDRFAAYYAARTVGSNATTRETDLGTVTKPEGSDGRRVKANLCADIAQSAASLLLGTGVGCVFDGDPVTQEYVEAMLTSGLESRLLEGAETASAFGGCFLRLVADPALSPKPYVTVVEPNRVHGEWVDGILVAATVWTELHRKDNQVVRFVEHRNNRTRTIECAVYVGTPASFGQMASVKDFPETAHLNELTRYPAGVDSMVVYWANNYPNRRYPWLPVGRSDFQGSESLLAAADIAATELARDTRLSRTRVIVPSGSISKYGDQEREIYTELDGVDPATGGIATIQGNIRSTELQAVLDGFKAQIVSSAGYSPQSFGLGEYGSGDSGTALRVRERRTISTTQAKRRLATPVIETVVRNLLALARTIHNAPVNAATPTVVWTEIVSDDPLEKAQSIQTLVNAKAVSIRTAVRLAQPDLDDTGVEEEVQRILDENGLTADSIVNTLDATLPSGF